MSTSIQSHVNCMFFQGIVPHEDKAMIKVGDYTIEFTREEVPKQFFDLQFNYNCSIIFYDLTGREVRRVVINEYQAMQLIDGINAAVYDDFDSEIYLISNINGPTLFETYTLCLNREYFNEYNPSDSMYNLIIYRYNGAIETLDQVLNVRMGLDDLDKFVDTAFFIFLIDIASEREGIFSNGGNET